MKENEKTVSLKDMAPYIIFQTCKIIMKILENRLIIFNRISNNNK